MSTDFRKRKSTQNDTNVVKIGRRSKEHGKIGNLSIDVADRLANIFWANKYGPVMDSVTLKKICLLCVKNVPESAYSKHVNEEHPCEITSVTKIMKRMSEIRLLRFSINQVVRRDVLQKRFPSLESVIEEFLVGRGFVNQKEGNVIAWNSSSVDSFHQTMNFSVGQNETEIKGVEFGVPLSSSMALEMSKSGGIMCLPEILFPVGIELAGKTETMKYAKTKFEFCYFCDRLYRAESLRKHIKTHAEVWKTISSISEDLSFDVEVLADVFRRMNKIRLSIFTENSIVQLSEVENLVGEEYDYVEPLLRYLMECGFVVDLQGNENLRLDVSSYIQTEVESVTTDSESYTSESVKESSSEADSDTSSVSSYTSSLSEASEKLLTMEMPYVILNGLTTHPLVEAALLNIVETLEVEDLSAKKFGFLLGYASYALVVSNGCKMVCIARMTLGDFQRAVIDEQNSICVISFAMFLPGKGNPTIEYVVADDTVFRALDVYCNARNKHVRSSNQLELLEDDSPFFLTHSLMRVAKDMDYPMRQFLKMIGIEWSCRSTQIIAESEKLVQRDGKGVETAVQRFKGLREKEAEHVRILGRISNHPTYKKVKPADFSAVTKTRRNGQK